MNDTHGREAAGSRRVRLAGAEALRPLHPMTRVLAPDLVVLETRVAEVERELAAARAEADRCVAEARDEAAAIVAAAEAEQDEIERRMRAEALAAAESGIRSLVESLRAEETSRRDDFPREVAEAALAMCRALLSHAVRCDADVLVEMITETLAAAAHGRDAGLVLHPSDYDLLGARFDEIAVAQGRGAGLRLVLDDRLPRGSVRVETERGIHDGSLERRLADLERHVRGRLGGIAS